MIHLQATVVSDSEWAVGGGPAPHRAEREHARFSR